jgi:hypothetical protein
MKTEYLKKQAWDYFQLHANQRMTTLNFFIAVSSIIIAGIGVTLKNEFDYPSIKIVLGAMLSFLSFVFWKLDQRNRVLIKIAEKALMEFENENYSANELPVNDYVKIFTHEMILTEQVKSKRCIMVWKNQYSFSECFNLIYSTFAAVGLLTILSAIFLH